MADIYAYATKFTRGQLAGKRQPAINMENRKPGKSGAPRPPEWNVPNARAAAELDRRRKSFDAVANKHGYTRPGSMKPYGRRA